MGLEFRILGPLETARDGVPVVLPAARERALLAILLVHANAVVSTDRLLHELWGEQPPRTALSALHNSVSRLRKALRPDVVQTRPAGYVLEPAAEGLDADRFERLCGEAAGAAPTDAAERLREALSLWRGPALVDFTYEPFAQAAIARLEDLHITALEDRIDADLALGRHDLVVGELNSLVVEHPFRERFHGQLMVALYRAGRQADALSAYQNARRAFLDELGVEPGPALKELERAILRHDAELAAPVPSGVSRSVEASAAEFAGERLRTLTVVLADLELAPTGGELEAEAFRAVAVRCSGVLRAELERYGGAVERFAGDAVIGVFGVPRSHEDDALRAVVAAEAARSALEGLRDELREEWHAEVAVRIAISTGEMIESGAEALLTGPPLAAAKRIQTHAAPGDLLLTETTLHLVSDGVVTEPAHVTPEQPAWRVTEVRDPRPHDRHLEGLLVGRKQELALLQRTFGRVQETGRGELVTLVGPAGIGKTRLALELARRVASEATVVTGQCPSFGEGLTYWPLTEILDQLPPSEDAARVRALLEGAPGAGELFLAVRRLFGQVARERPLVLVLEDVHWAEPTFLDFVVFLSERLSGARVLILCVAREELLEERPDWGANGSSVVLEGLSASETNELVDALAGAGEVVSETRARLVEAADGNPLFVEQLLTVVLLGEPGGLPPTLEALLAARLDRLGPGERAVVDAASVAGRDFSRPGVEELLPEAAGSVDRHLRELVHKDLIRPRREQLLGENAFSFRHVLVREAAYRTTPKARRAHLHRRFAARLDRRAPRLDELIGYHLEQAWLLRRELGPLDAAERRMGVEAGERLGRAGSRAWRRGDAPGAANLLGRAYSLLAEGEPRRELACELGVAHRAQGDVERAEQILADTASAAAAAGDRRVELRARIELVDLLLWTRPERRADELLELTQAAIPVLEAAGDDRSLGRAWLLMGEVRGGLHCDNTAWEECAERALTHYARSGWPISTCLQAITAALYYGPAPVEQALDRCRSLVEQYEGAGGASALLVIGGLEAQRGRFDEALRVTVNAREKYLELGQRVRAAEFVDAVHADIHFLGDDPSAAEAVLRRSCEELESLGAFSSLATRAAQLAEALYQLDRDSEADEWTRTSERHTGPDDVSAQFSWRGVRAKILARRGAGEAAETIAREAVALAERTDAVNQHAKALLDLAEVLQFQKRSEHARPLVEQALSLYERKGNMPAAERTRTLLAELPPVGAGPARKAPDGAVRAS